MSTDSPNGADVNLEIAGQKVNLRNIKSLNTFLTLVAALASSFGVYLLVEHQNQSRDASRVFIEAVKEQTVVMKEQTSVAREQNCLIAMPMDRRDPEFCKRIAR